MSIKFKVKTVRDFHKVISKCAALDLRHFSSSVVAEMLGYLAERHQVCFCIVGNWVSWGWSDMWYVGPQEEISVEQFLSETSSKAPKIVFEG